MLFFTCIVELVLPPPSPWSGPGDTSQEAGRRGTYASTVKNIIMYEPAPYLQLLTSLCLRQTVVASSFQQPWPSSAAPASAKIHEIPRCALIRTATRDWQHMLQRGRKMIFQKEAVLDSLRSDCKPAASWEAT